MMMIESVGNAGLAAVVPVLTGDAFNAMRKPKPDTSALHFISASFGFFSFSATKRIPEKGLFLLLLESLAGISSSLYQIMQPALHFSK
jgi:hypothetical protein